MIFDDKRDFCIICIHASYYIYKITAIFQGILKQELAYAISPEREQSGLIRDFCCYNYNNVSETQYNYP